MLGSLKRYWKVWKFWIISLGILVVFLTIVGCLLYKNYRFVWPKEINIQDFVFGLTGVIVYIYTLFTARTFYQLRRSQNLSTLSNLTQYYNEISRARVNIFKKGPVKGLKDIEESDLTELSNFLDGFGHIAYHLPPEDQDIVIERWAETFIRSWIRLQTFIYQKREKSIGRDYPFFEWLASKSFEYHRDNFEGRSIKFYRYRNGEFKFFEIWEQREDGFYPKAVSESPVLFKKSDEVEEEHIKKKRRAFKETYPEGFEEEIKQSHFNFDDKEIKRTVSFEDLFVLQVVPQEALTRLLMEKGIFSKEEFLEMVKLVNREMKSNTK